MRRGLFRAAPAAALLALANGSISLAQTGPPVAGAASGQLIVYFHMEQNDVDQVQLFCRRQVQEETAGFAWGDKFAYDVPNNPDDPAWDSYGYQWRPRWDYDGYYRINNVSFGDVNNKAELTTTLRTITYNGPPGAYVGPECGGFGPVPVMEANVTGTHDGKTLSCSYQDGAWSRIGTEVNIDLHGTCTITDEAGVRHTAPVYENRRMVELESCYPPRPGTGILGAGDCSYNISATVSHDP